MPQTSTTSPAAPNPEPQPDTTASAPPSSGELDLNRYRVPQSFSATGAVKQMLNSVPVRKPGKQAFIYLLPGEEWTTTVPALITEEDRAYYLLTPEVAANEDPELIKIVRLSTYIERSGVIALWPVNLSREGRSNPWTDSALDIVANMTGRWLNVRASQAHGAYLVSEPAMTFPAPAVPAYSLARLVTVAFKGKVIDSNDHPVLQRLRGEI